jgi:hypothetical protein
MNTKDLISEVIPSLKTSDSGHTALNSMDILKISQSFDQPGAIIVLELNERDYSLSQIAQIIESNNAKVISMYVASPADSLKLEMTIKLNSNEISSVIRTFERYNIYVKTWTASSDSIDQFYQERFDLFMKYLNI